MHHETERNLIVALIHWRLLDDDNPAQSDQCLVSVSAAGTCGTKWSFFPNVFLEFSEFSEKNICH